VFPINAEILLGLPVNQPPPLLQRSDPYCGPSVFLPEQRLWNNPLNWKTPKDKMLPFIERVPCEYDDVVFPKVNIFLYMQLISGYPNRYFCHLFKVSTSNKTVPIKRF